MTRRRGIFVFVKRCRFAKSPLKKGGLNTTGQLFRIPLVKRVLHILEVNLQRPDRDLNLPDRNAQRTDQQQQRRTEDISRKQHQPHVDQKHRHHAQEQARDAQQLHRAREVEPPAEVVDLRARHLRGVLQMLLLERAHQLRIGQKPVGVGQQNQRHGRKQQGGGRKREFFHRYRDLRCKDTLFIKAKGERL